jgi:DNA topoisomerase I
MKTSSAATPANEEPSIPLDPVDSAKSAGLRYVTDDSPGLQRCNHGKGFIYKTADGKPIRDPDVIRRINALAIPPAWRDVWICLDPNGHLQATGRDAKGRKQYRYHPHWREVRDQTKYDKMLAFAKQLPAIRRQVEKDLGVPGLPRQKVLATVVRLLETGMVRVGNQEYVRQNKSYGAVTLRARHVDVSGRKIRFEFRGKSGVQHSFDLNDHRLAKIIRRCQELPGHELFKYIDENRELCAIDSADVNDYLRNIAGEEFTSKDFRTWAGTLLAARALCEFCGDNAKATKRNVARAIDNVARQLGNTRAVCRNCYIHPAVIESYLNHSLADAFRTRSRNLIRARASALTPEETSLVALLEHSLRTDLLDKRTSLREKLRRSLILKKQQRTASARNRRAAASRRAR